LILLLGVLSCWRAVRAGEPAVGVPALYCAEQTYEFGERESGEAVRHTFTLENRGDALLEIERVRKTCGCTTAELSTNAIAPGVTAELDVVLSLAGRVGGQHKSVILESNDPANPHFRLSMKGTAVTSVRLEPQRLNFGRIPDNATEHRDIRVVVRPGLDLAVDAVRIDSPLFRADIDTAYTNRDTRITVTTVPPLPLGQHNAAVKIHTDNARYPVLTTGIRARVVGELYCAPREILLYDEKDAKPVRRIVVVRGGSLDSFSIVDVKAPEGDMRVEIEKRGKDYYRIVLDQLVASSALTNKALVIKTTAPTMKEIRIPFVLRAAKTAPE